jgi:hypothetical protein
MTGKNPWGVEISDSESFAGTSTDVEQVHVGEIAEFDPDHAILARSRFETLTTSFASLMGLIATMYQEEDWKHLTKEDGSAYRTLTEVVADALHLSAAMARRYVQGTRELYIPLSSIAIEGTIINIDSSHMRDLGSVGAKEVVDLAAIRLEGIANAEEASDIIDETIKEVRNKPEETRQPDEPFQKDESGAWMDNDGGEEFDQEVLEGKGYCGTEGNGTSCYFPEDHISPHDWEDLDDRAPAVALSMDIEDPITDLIASGKNYLDPAERAALSLELQEVVDALAVLASFNPAAYAQHIDFETRGIGKLLPTVSQNCVRLQTLIEAQPWLLSRLV